MWRRIVDQDINLGLARNQRDSDAECETAPMPIPNSRADFTEALREIPSKRKQHGLTQLHGPRARRAMVKGDSLMTGVFPWPARAPGHALLPDSRPPALPPHNSPPLLNSRRNAIRALMRTGTGSDAATSGLFSDPLQPLELQPGRRLRPREPAPVSFD
jgi:hypothetical protein